jgi:signal transduction histidine kinase
LRRSVFALRPVLTGVLEMLRPLAARRGITLRLAAGEAMPHLLFTDPARLRQVLLNLLSNAAKYAAPGEVLLIAESIEIDGGPHLRLAVRDQGPAISEVERARLFQPFSQLDQPSQSGQPGQSEQTGQSAAEVQPGSGLGLAICRLLATLAGGAVGCETIELSPMGQPRRAGNEFWMTMPICQRTSYRPYYPLCRTAASCWSRTSRRAALSSRDCCAVRATWWTPWCPARQRSPPCRGGHTTPC